MGLILEVNGKAYKNLSRIHENVRLKTAKKDCIMTSVGINLVGVKVKPFLME